MVVSDIVSRIAVLDMMKLSQLILCLGVFVVGVTGHGYLSSPPQRSSAWRFGFNTPANYDHMQLFCGGFSRQWKKNDGKCGTCGDPYDGYRENEAGGKYATGTITGSYMKGEIMEVEVTLTAYHKGWFEFKLCAHNNPTEAVSQQCLNQTRLRIAGTQSTRYDINNLGIGTGKYTIPLQLPAEMTCTQCVLQWTYNTGNNWGKDKKGSGIGFGKQEQFVNCADIEILEQTPKPTVNPSSSSSTTTTTTTTTTAKPSTIESTTVSTIVNGNTATARKPTPPTIKQTTTTTNQPSTTPKPTTTTTKATTTTRPPTTTTSKATTTPTPTTATTTTKATPTTGSTTPVPTAPPTVSNACTGELRCTAVAPWAGIPGMRRWCINNCSRGFCPRSHCSCRPC